MPPPIPPFPLPFKYSPLSALIPPFFSVCPSTGIFLTGSLKIGISHFHLNRFLGEGGYAAGQGARTAAPRRGVDRRPRGPQIPPAAPREATPGLQEMREPAQARVEFCVPDLQDEDRAGGQPRRLRDAGRQAHGPPHPLPGQGGPPSPQPRLPGEGRGSGPPAGPPPPHVRNVAGALDPADVGARRRRLQQLLGG